MAMEAILTEGIAHAVVGVALAVVDFITSRVANPHTTRMERKKKCLQAIEILLDLENAQKKATTEEGSAEGTAEVPTLRKDSTQYAEHIKIIRDYLLASGLVKLELPLSDRIIGGVKNVIAHEKINGLSNLQKLGVAVGVEILYDIVTFTPAPAAAIATDVYQIPAFFVGLWLGNWVKKVIEVMLGSSDEKKLDKTIQQLLKETSIVEVVVNYTPPEHVKNDFAERGIEIYTSKLTRAGQTVFKNLKQLATSAKSTAEDVMSFAQKREEQQEQEREEHKKRFDELTKGH